jgi:hypothetical protein
MRNNLIVILLLSCFSVPIYAQTDVDAIRFSQNYSGGTARSLGLSGAFGALGGDPSSLSINPAGIGVYRASEFTFTTGINVDNVKSSYINKAEDDKYKMNISNLAYVYTFNTNKNTGWVSASFGIGYNRLAEFNRNVAIRGTNVSSSLLDEFAYNSNNGMGSEFYEDVAYEGDVLLLDQNTNTYHSDFTGTSYGITQKKNIVTKGGIGEYDFSFGANFSHIVYLGMTLGIQRVDYEELKDHSEYDASNVSPYLGSYSFDEHFNAYGSGVNVKFGAIVKPVDFLRIGAAIHTPTFYNLNSEFYTSINSHFEQGTPLDMNKRSAMITTDYDLRTPFKAVGSVAFVFEKYGLFSLDYEYVDYTKAKFKSEDVDYDIENSAIDEFYQSTSNIKAGLEGRLGPISARVGYAYYGSPYKDNNDQINKDYSYQSYSAGLGVRGKSAFFDVAYVLSQSKEDHRLYGNNIAKLDNSQTKIMATLGFRF